MADPPPAEPLTRRHARPRQRALKIDDDLLEELRRQMGITREQAVRLARLVLLPPPDVLEGHVTTTLPTGECPGSTNRHDSPPLSKTPHVPTAAEPCLACKRSLRRHHVPTAAERRRYAQIQPYVPYRLMLLQRLLPIHFASAAEYAAFKGRPLMAADGRTECD